MKDSQAYCAVMRKLAVLSSMVAALFLTTPAQAQPANDNFASAEELVGRWGSVSNDLMGATLEASEPTHAGWVAGGSVWYRWTASTDGEVTLDTHGSLADTILAVYTGTDVAHLTQVAANDEAYPTRNDGGRSTYSGRRVFMQPFRGPSSLRFNATAGQVYYFAVAGRIPASFNLSWAYNSSGIFRFATEDYDSQLGMLLYEVAEQESFPERMHVSTMGNYYVYDVPGAIVSVTRVAGSSGRVAVQYRTEDLTAVAGSDYLPVQGELVFDDYEMTKHIIIPVLGDFGMPNTNREFMVILSDPVRDPFESEDVSTPRVDPVFGTAIVRLLDMDIDPFIPGNYDTNGVLAGPTNAVFNFAKAHYRVSEDINDPAAINNTTEVTIYVTRSGMNNESKTLHYRINNYLGSDRDINEQDNNVFPLQAGSDYATPTPENAANLHGRNPDFDMVRGTVSFGQDDWDPKAITFTINNDQLPEFNEDFHVFLYELVNNRPRVVGMVNETTITILADDQDIRAGSVDQWHNPDYGLEMAPPIATIPPNQDKPGVDSTAYAMLSDNFGRTIVAGEFSSYNGTARNRIARANADGTLDTAFNPGSGADAFISAMAPAPDNRVYIAGAFTSYNGVSRNRIARINNDGSLDMGFDPGLGANGVVWAVLSQPDGKLLIAGDFTAINDVPAPYLARLNTDGSVDTTFNLTTNAPDSGVKAIAIDNTGRIVIGGDFTSMGQQSWNHLARLNANGSLDQSFNIGTGVDGFVYALSFQQDGRLLVAGDFSRINTTKLGRIGRLNANGSVDNTFFPGVGANDAVYTILQNGNRVYIGGLFTKYNGTRRAGLARLYADGTLDTTFLDTSYNHFAGLPSRYFDSFVENRPFVYSVQVDSTGDVMIAGGFERVGGGQFNFAAQASDFNELPEPKTRNGIRNRMNFAKLHGGSSEGPGNLSLLYSSYEINRKQSFLYISLIRENGYLGNLTANFSIAPGLVVSGTDYIYNALPPKYMNGWGNTRMLSDGLFSTNTLPIDSFGTTYLAITDDKVIVSLLGSGSVGDVSTTLRLDNPSGQDIFFLGGENIPLGGALGRSSAAFKVIDDQRAAGVVGFVNSATVVSETSSNLVLNLVRTNGSDGSISVRYATQDGTAKAGVNYKSKSGIVTFNSGETTQTVTIDLVDGSAITPGDVNFAVRLFSPSGTSIFAATNTVTIIDNDGGPGRLTFSQGAYSTNESSLGVILEIRRSGGSLGVLDANAVTLNGTGAAGALAGVHFEGLTNLLHWDSGDITPRYVHVKPIDNLFVSPAQRTFTVALQPLTVGATIGTPGIATINLLDDDAIGQVAFSAPSYIVNEQGGHATITVLRTVGAAESLAVSYRTVDGTALSSGPAPNYVAVSGTLSFAPGEVAKSFDVPVLNNGVQDVEPFFFTVELTESTPAGLVATPNPVLVNIVDAQSVYEPAGALDNTFDPVPGINGDVYNIAVQPDGKIVTVGDFTVVNSSSINRLARLNGDGSLDSSFLLGLQGANAPVRGLALQTDGRLVVSGSFTLLNGVSRNRIGRLLSDGRLDTSFNVGAGADNDVFVVSEIFSPSGRRILAGGSFDTYNSMVRHGLVQLNNDGTVDQSFNPALNINGTVYAIAVYPTNGIHAGKILIGGDFTTINEISRSRVARLNPDGTLDPTFDPGQGTSGTVRALALQADGALLVGGSFTNFNGVALNNIARLRMDGSVDSTFNIGLGANNTIEKILVQPDNRILLAGHFTRASDVTRSRITRLLSDGTVDPSINFGTGANSFIQSLALQTNGMIIISGGFTEYDGQTRHRVARVYGGSMAGSGTLEFTQGAYVVTENATNAIVSVRRRAGTSGNVGATFKIANGTAVEGINFSNVTAQLNFPIGETFQSVVVPVLHDNQINTGLIANMSLVSLTGGAMLGNQPVATLVIDNVDSAVSFAGNAFARNENAIDKAATMRLVRQGSLSGISTVEFITTTNGSAVPNIHFKPVTNVVVFQPGDTEALVKVPLMHDPAAQGDRTVHMVLTNSSNALLFAPSEALLTIIDVDRAAGQISFAVTNVVVGEDVGQAVIAVVRTNGRSGTVTVKYRTLQGTAMPEVRYVASQGSLTFGDSETFKMITIPILQTSQVEGHQSFQVELFEAGGGATLGIARSTVTILDDEWGLAFVNPIHVVNEMAGSVTVGVQRVGTNGTTTVQYQTTNVTAVAGTNYQPAAGLLTFAPGETFKTFNVPVTHDPRVTGDLSFRIDLLNPSAPATLFAPASTTVVVVDNDPGVTFTNANFYALKSGTNVTISVVRSNANTGTVSVDFATSNLTAVAGVDYVSTNGTLWFSNGIALQTFTVPVLNNRLVQGDRVFNIGLFNATGGAQILPPTYASVTITDDVSGLSFSAPTYTVSEKGVSRRIEVVRTGYLDSTVTVGYSTANGTAVAGANYMPATGVLTFTNGQTSQSFDITVIDNNVVDGDKTVLLNLAPPTGNAVLVNPSAATLNILEADGSLIVPAGVALVSESGPVNGYINTNETVTILFGLRNSAGTNTGNLVATLMATNGVTLPSAPQTYGALPVHGPAVSRPFTFTAAGTNGQRIGATFLLKDGPAENLVVFNFVLGQTTHSFSNIASIVIGDKTNATPYPSVINVSGLPGNVGHVRVTLTNFNHTAPSDLNVVLVSPAGGKTYLMSRAGGRSAVSRTTINFDDTASQSLPVDGLITEGVYKPSAYSAQQAQMPLPAPPAPYVTNLASLAGANPNGPWSLYVADTIPWDLGVISNGWQLHITLADFVKPSADLALGLTASAQSVVVTSNYTYRVSVTNHGPGTAESVVVTHTLAPNVSLIGTGPSVGQVIPGGENLVWNLGSMAVGATATLEVTVKPLSSGMVASTATVSSATQDSNPNNSGTVDVTVLEPEADLVLVMTTSASPMILGTPVVYTLNVTNLGPATANGLVVEDTLPAGVSFVSATPAGYQVTGRQVKWSNLTLGDDKNMLFTITGMPLASGDYTNRASVRFDGLDPRKANSEDSKKIVVEGLAIVRAANTLQLKWLADGKSRKLESAPTPAGPWQQEQFNLPQAVDGYHQLTIPVQSGSRFYRLRLE